MTPEESKKVTQDLKQHAAWRRAGIRDELDGRTDAHEEVFFGLDDEHYAIYVNYAHGDELRSLLAPYVAAAREARTADAEIQPTQGPSVQ